MQEQKATTENIFPIWWSISWKTGLVVFGGSVIVNLIISTIGGYLGDLLSGLAPIVYILCSFYFFKSAINKNYKNIRLLILSIENKPDTENGTAR